MDNNPLVSIGMPVYNCEATVAEAIASILNQTFKEWELIVIDDGSTDETFQIAQQFSGPRVRVIRGDSNKHLPARLNEAVFMARGKYFARMDGDDISYPDRLRKQIDFLEIHPEVDLLGGSILVFGKNYKAIGLRKARLTHAEICGSPWRASTLPHMTWFGRRDWFVRNPYREDTSHAQDRELLTRTRRESQFAAIPDIIAGVREVDLTLKKQLPSRHQFLRALTREGVRQKDISMLALGIPAELAKLSLDVIAIKTGLKYRILKHRVPRVPQEALQQWSEVLHETSNIAAQFCQTYARL